jgi:hypothetical protein
LPCLQSSSVSRGSGRGPFDTISTFDKPACIRVILWYLPGECVTIPDAFCSGCDLIDDCQSTHLFCLSLLMRDFLMRMDCSYSRQAQVTHHQITCGYQSKLSRSYPKWDLPERIACGYLLRGNPYTWSISLGSWLVLLGI